MNNIKKISVIVLLGFTLSLNIVPVFAQTPPKEKTQLSDPQGPGTSADQPLIQCGGVDKNGNPQPECGVGDLNKLIQDLLNLVFMFGGFIVAAMFMYAGFLLITSVGDTGKIQKAKDIFKRVVVGFLIMFLAYLTVKNLLTKINLDDTVKPLFMNLFK